MSPNDAAPSLSNRGFPRVSGDEPGPADYDAILLTFSHVSGDDPARTFGAQDANWFSPRERG